MLSVEIASILPSHWGFYHELHEDPSFASITVMKKLLISSMLFVSLMSTINFTSLRLDKLHSTLGSFFCHNRPGIRVFESLLGSQRKSALFVVPEESWFAHILSCGSEFLEHLKFVSQTASQRVSPFYHDWRTTTDWTTNLFLESDRLVYGTHHLLAPRWTVVKRAPCWCWRHRTRSLSETILDREFLDVLFSSLHDEEVGGLITCERVVLGKGAKVLISWSAQGICPPHRGRWSWWAGGRTGW